MMPFFTHAPAHLGARVRLVEATVKRLLPARAVQVPIDPAYGRFIRFVKATQDPQLFS